MKRRRRSGEDTETRRRTFHELADLRDIAARLLDADDVRMRGQPADRLGKQVHAGDGREVVQQHGDRRCVGNRRVVTHERVRVHLRFVEPGRAHEHTVGAERRGPAHGLNRRLRRFASGAHDKGRGCGPRFASDGDGAIRFVLVEQHGFARRSEHDDAVERARGPARACRSQPRLVELIVTIERCRDWRENAPKIHPGHCRPARRPRAARRGSVRARAGTSRQLD